MKSRNIMRVICAVLVLCFTVSGLVACGGSDKVKVIINDSGKKTEVEVEVGKTVSDALDAAKITLGDKDTCEPKADEKITKDTKEITVTRAAAIETPTEAPKTEAPTQAPTAAPTEAPKTEAPTEAVTEAPQVDDGGDSNDNGGEDYGNDDGGYDDGNYDDGGNDDGGVYEVDRVAMPDCDGSGHGYYIITYSDGSTGTEEY